MRRQPESVLSYYSDAEDGGLSDRQTLTWRVGDTTREIIERLVGSRAPDADLADIADQLDAVADALRRHEHGRSYERFAEASTATAGPPSGHVEYSPLIGRANPIAPLMAFSLDDEVLTAEVTFGSAYEGPPGSVHGGLVAAAFDEVMGAAQGMTGNPGMTGRLSVSYRSPTPLHQPLVVRAWIERVEGRKIFVNSTLHVRKNGVERLCAESEALFISVDFARLAAMMAERNETA